MPSVSAHVAQVLARNVDHVFGVMGNGNAWFLDALDRTDATFTAVRHEAGGVVAADAYFRASGRIAAATTTYGAGFTNTLTALAEAAQARIPLVVVVGDEPTAGPRPWGVDQIALASAIGVRTYTVGTRDAASATALAIEQALIYRRPFVVAIPYDIATGDAGDVPATAPLAIPDTSVSSNALTDAGLDRIADALLNARRPLLLAGRGAWLANAGDALGDLAEIIGAVTATTALGRGIFPDDRYDVGVTGGFGAEGAMALVREADVAVVFGAGLNQFTMRFGQLFDPKSLLFQIDVAGTATHPQVGGFVRSDAADAARKLIERLRDRDAVSSSWGETVDIPALRVNEPGEPLAPDGRLDPRSAAVRIAELLPEDRVVVSDGGHFLGWSNMYWPVAAPDRNIMIGTAYQSIGLGFPSVPGAAAARPESTIVLTTGDGGGLMALADLESAVRVAKGRGLAIVWNDAAYGAEVNLYGKKGLAQGPMRIPEVNFAAVANGFGAEGIVVSSIQDLDTLGSWAARDPNERPFLLLDLRISGDIIAPYWREIVQMNS